MIVFYNSVKNSKNCRFSGETMVLYGKAIFLPLFCKIRKKSSEAFFGKVSKTSIFCIFWPFLALFADFGQNAIFFEKSGRAIFLTFLTPNFVPNFRKILGTVIEINPWRTHGQDWFYRSLRFLTGDQKQKSYWSKTKKN